MKTKISVVIAALSIGLVGCGGGGGGSAGTSPVPTPTPGPVVDVNALQASVAVASYSTGSFEAEAYSALSNARSQYGVGLVAESSPLNMAANNHAKYIVAQFQAGDYSSGHTENPAKSGYTGATPLERAQYAKFDGSAVAETIAGFIEVDGVQSKPGVVAIDNLLSAPYHRIALLGGQRNVGVGHASIRIAGEGGLHHVFVANFGIQNGQQAQLPPQDWIGVWPASGAVDVMYGFAGEMPDPIPVVKGACAGYPVSMQIRNGLTLTTKSFTLSETVSGAPVDVQLSTADTDKNPEYANGSTAYIIPFKPLKAGVQYTAKFSGAKNGVAFDKSWSFTTVGKNTRAVYGCDPS
jgi:uncharacterized protein YkwD